MSAQTLTFLFTDIEGSTPLWDRDPAAMTTATERHNAILRDVIAAHGGDAFRVVGDAFCVAFSDALAAVAAAVESQRQLRAQPWGTTPIHVRMGLHSGAVEAAADEVFRGPSLARAARVMAAAHGDQVLASAATVALLGAPHADDIALRDLGDHTLRGFARAERIYQVIARGLRAEFPPIATPEALRTNLPPALTTFVGRTQALAEVREAVQASRVVTLAGPGGTGKTRLALEAAGALVDTFDDGVWLVELAAVADATTVPHAVAGALGARAEGDVPPLTLIEAALRDRRVLLLLDNCEHVVEEAATLAEALLRALPRLHVLATSREALGVAGERVYRVPSLGLPAEGCARADDVLATEAGTLFATRAAAVAPHFTVTDANAAAVARVCRRLDGIPLAIELAAARLTALSVDDLARRVDDRFRLLTGGLRTALPRQRTLRALVDWSYELLTADERSVLDTLAVFAGSFTLEAAEQVVDTALLRDMSLIDALERLVAKSLVLVDHTAGSDTRYRLLETIRQYAGEKLMERGAVDVARRRHFDYFAALAQEGADALYGPYALEWLDRLEAEQENLRAALEWSAPVVPPDHARLAGLLARFWDTRGYFSEGFARLEHAMSIHAAPDAARLAALIGAGLLAHRLDFTARSDAALVEALELAQALQRRDAECDALLCLAMNRMWRGGAAVEPLARRALVLAQALGDVAQQGMALLMVARALNAQHDHAGAQAMFVESAQHFERAGCVLRLPLAVQYAGTCALHLQELATARALLEDALLRHRRMGNVHDAASTLGLLGQTALHEGRSDEAVAQAAESVRMFRALHDANCGALASVVLAHALRVAGDLDGALAAAQSAATTFRAVGSAVRLSDALHLVGSIKLAQDDRRAAGDALAEALEAQRSAQDIDRLPPGVLETVAALYPDDAEAPVLLGAAAAMREREHIPISGVQGAYRDRCIETVRAAHARAAFEQAQAAGRALRMDAAAERAAALLAARDARRTA